MTGGPLGPGDPIWAAPRGPGSLRCGRPCNSGFLRAALSALLGDAWEPFKRPPSLQAARSRVCQTVRVRGVGPLTLARATGPPDTLHRQSPAFAVFPFSSSSLRDADEPTGRWLAEEAGEQGAPGGPGSGVWDLGFSRGPRPMLAGQAAGLSHTAPCGSRGTGSEVTCCSVGKLRFPPLPHVRCVLRVSSFTPGPPNWYGRECSDGRLTAFCLKAHCCRPTEGPLSGAWGRGAPGRWAREREPPAGRSTTPAPVVSGCRRRPLVGEARRGRRTRRARRGPVGRVRRASATRSLRLSSRRRRAPVRRPLVSAPRPAETRLLSVRSSVSSRAAAGGARRPGAPSPAGRRAPPGARWALVSVTLCLRSTKGTLALLPHTYAHMVNVTWDGAHVRASAQLVATPHRQSARRRQGGGGAVSVRAARAWWARRGAPCAS